MNADADHRVMLLTPPGTGAIGVVRVVGPRAADLVRHVFRASSSDPPQWERSDALAHGLIMDGDEVLDDVLVGSVEVDGARAVDICAHGGVRVMERLVILLEREGAELVEREAVPAEVWPARNLIEKEASNALGGALTERAVRFAAYQREHLARAVEKIAASFAADPPRGIDELEAILRLSEGARLLLEGATVAIIGPPNSGKSTLLNRLAGRQVAVASDRPGTTRDWVSAAVEMCGFPVTLVDTAGDHPGIDALEREAVESGRGVSGAADVRVVLLDGSVELDSLSRRLLDAAKDDPRAVVVLNKRDLAPMGDASAGERAGALWISAMDGTGVDELARRVATVLGADPGEPPQPTAFTDRQVRVIRSVISDPPAGPGSVARRLLGELLGIAR